MYVTSPLFQQLGIRHGFTTRRGGVSLPPFDTFNLGLKSGDQRPQVETNLRLLAQRLEVGIDDLFWAAQESRDQIVTVEAISNVATIRQTAADALMHFSAAIPGGEHQRPVLCIRTADCLPVLVYAPVSATKGAAKNVWLAAVHVGWQGAYLELLGKTLKQLSAQGVSLADTFLAFGPAIGPCCLRLAGRVKGDFESKFPGHTAFIKRPDDPTAIYLDLWQHSLQMAVALGVDEKNIDILNSCTSCEHHKFFSYRRDGAATGRHLSFIG